MIPLLMAGAIGLVVSLLGTRYLIDWLRAHRVGQPIHDDVQVHSGKAGTPTMGGVAIVVAAVIGYGAAHFNDGLVFTRSGVLVMLTIAASGVVGAVDDWIKVSQERNLGLSSRAKMGGLLLVAVGFSVAALTWTDVETTVSFTRWNEPGWELGNVGWLILAVLLIAGTTNAVNLTDGLDGLAAGSALYAFGAMTVIGFWAFRHPTCTGSNTPSTWPSSPPRWSGRRSGSSGGTRRRRRSSWATPGRWRWVPAWPPCASRSTPSCCCRSSARCSCSRRCR